MFKWLKRQNRNVKHEIVCLNGSNEARAARWYAEKANGRTIRMSQALARILTGVRMLHKDFAALKAQAKEDSLGPVIYEITAADLFLLGASDRSVVCQSGANSFNEVQVTTIARVQGSLQSTVERIMDWRRDCVLRITEEQVNEAINASNRAVAAAQKGGN